MKAIVKKALVGLGKMLVHRFGGPIAEAVADQAIDTLGDQAQEKAKQAVRKVTRRKK
jgi:hypothetical protein